MARVKPEHVAVMDTTLRDGEQTPDVAYTPAEKLQLATLLLKEVGVDRIEIASTRVSEGERKAARLIARWARGAGCLERVEILGYCDGKASVDWITGTGGQRDEPAGQGIRAALPRAARHDARRAPRRAWRRRCATRAGASSP